MGGHLVGVVVVVRSRSLGTLVLRLRLRETEGVTKCKIGLDEVLHVEGTAAVDEQFGG